MWGFQKNNQDFPGGLLKTDGCKQSRLNGERRLVVDTCCLFGVREHEVTVQQLSGRRQGPVVWGIMEFANKNGNKVQKNWYNNTDYH